MKLFISKYWKPATAITISLLIILGVSLPISGKEKLAESLVAWATLVLAFVAFWSIRKSSAENKYLREMTERRYEEDKVRNSRRDSLNPLHIWALEAINFLDEEHSISTKIELLDLWQKASNLRSSAINLGPLGAFFDDDFDKIVANATTQFIEYHSTILNIAKSMDIESSISQTDREGIKKANKDAWKASTNLSTHIGITKVKYQL